MMASAAPSREGYVPVNGVSTEIVSDLETVTPESGAGGSRRAATCPGEEGAYLGPERPPGSLLGLGKLDHGALITDANEVGVGPPVVSLFTSSRESVGQETAGVRALLSICGSVWSTCWALL
jgi:hypothetical protein